MEESESEEDCEYLLSRREVDELIDSIFKKPTASQKIRIKSKRGRSLVLHANRCNLPMLNFELKMQGCMPRTRNHNQS